MDSGLTLLEEVLYGDHALRILPVLAHLKRSLVEVKWQEARAWAESKVTTKKYRYSRLREPRQKPSSGPAIANKSGSLEVLPFVDVKSSPPLRASGALAKSRRGNLQMLPTPETPAENPVGGGAEGGRER